MWPGMVTELAECKYFYQRLAFETRPVFHINTSLIDLDKAHTAKRCTKRCSRDWDHRLHWYVVQRKVQRCLIVLLEKGRRTCAKGSITLCPPLDGSTLWFTPVNVGICQGPVNTRAPFAGVWLLVLLNENNQVESGGS